MKTVHRILDPARGSQVEAGLCALAVMTKAPRPGRVKTRLSPPLTGEEAAALNICFLRDTTTAIETATRKNPARGLGVYTPVGEEEIYGDILPPDFLLIPQRGDLFGQRLIFAAKDLFALGFAAVCLIDSDSPIVPHETYAQATKLLSQPSDRMVFGPSDDGGYYLIGLKKMHHRLFEEIDWSTERVAAQTLERAREINLPVELLPTSYDVDDHTTLRRLCDGLLAGNEHAPATKQFLQELIAREGRERIWPNEQ